MSDSKRKKKPDSPKSSLFKSNQWLKSSPTSSQKGKPKSAESLKGYNADEDRPEPWYQTVVPVKLKALLSKAKTSIQGAESWADYQEDPQWSFPLEKANVYLLDQSGAPNWFPTGPSLRFLNQQTAISAIRQFSSYSMERIHHYAMNGESLHSLYTARRLVDLLIHFKERSFYAHRCVMCTHSEFFANILLENDIPPYAITDVTLRNIDPDLFKRFLHFAYTGDVFVSLDTIYPMRRLANILKSRSLNAKLMIFMAQTGAMDLQEAVQILVNNFEYEAMPIAVEVVKSNFKMVLDDTRMYLFSFENFLEIISGDNLCINSELDAFWAVLFWVAYDYANRVNYFTQLLSQVRFTSMTSLELMDCAKVTEMIKLSDKCKKMLISANWVCHAREIGLEDPLALPEYPPRHCLTNVPPSPPTVAEFDERFLRYSKLISRQVNTFTDQMENTIQNAKRVFFTQFDEHIADEKDDEEEVEQKEALQSADEEPKQRSGFIMFGGGKKRKKIKPSPTSPKEVYIRKEQLPVDKDDDWKDANDSEGTADSEDSSKDKSKKKENRKKEASEDSNTTEKSSSEISLAEPSLEEEKESTEKKSKHSKSKLKDDNDKSSDKESPELPEKLNVKDSESLQEVDKKYESPQKDIESHHKHSKSHDKVNRKSRDKGHHKSHDKKQHKSKETPEQPDSLDQADEHPKKKRTKKKKKPFSDWLKKKKKEAEPTATDNIDDLLSKSDSEPKKTKLESLLKEMKSVSQSSLKSKPDTKMEDPGADGTKKDKHKKKKPKHKDKKDGEKKKKKDKNKQNKSHEASEDSGASSTEIQPEGECFVQTARHDSQDQSENASEVKLLDISDSFTLSSDQRSDTDALALWESNVFPIQDNCMLSGSILLPIRKQKITLTKTHEGKPVTEDNVEMQPQGSGHH